MHNEVFRSVSSYNNVKLGVKKCNEAQRSISRYNEV